MESTPALFAVALKCLLDDGERARSGREVLHFDVFAFELFVILEEPHEHRQTVRRQFVGLLKRTVLGIVPRDGQDLVIPFAAIEHGHHADGSSLHQRQRRECFLTQHKYVERIIVLGIGLGNEAVIGGIVNRRIENAIEAQESRRLVELVLDVGAGRDFHDSDELRGQILSRRNVVPGMRHRKSPLEMLGTTQNAVHLGTNPTFHEIVSHRWHEFRTNSPIEIRTPVSFRHGKCGCPYRLPAQIVPAIIRSRPLISIIAHCVIHYSEGFMRSLLHSSGAAPPFTHWSRPPWSPESRRTYCPSRECVSSHKARVGSGGGRALTDPNLVNAWGLAFSPTSPFWVANNGTNTSTLYSGDRVGPPAVPLSINPLVVNLPGGAPTGAVFNSTANDFVITDGTNTGKAAFIFVTEGGEIVGWSPGVPPPAPSTQGQIAMTVSGAIFKGVTIGQSGGNSYLYATDFHNGVIDVFDGQFNPVTLAGNFTDPHLPAGYAPFNIMAVGDKLYVTYAKQDAAGEDELHGVGLGFVDVFNTDGTFAKRLVQHGLLNAPWGMAIAPASFGSFGGDLLVGNFGNGQINAYNPETGHFVGSLRNAHGQKIKIDGLWALAFGNGGSAGDANAALLHRRAGR